MIYVERSRHVTRRSALSAKSCPPMSGVTIPGRIPDQPAIKVSLVGLLGRPSAPTGRQSAPNANNTVAVSVQG